MALAMQHLFVFHTLIEGDPRLFQIFGCFSRSRFASGYPASSGEVPTYVYKLSVTNRVPYSNLNQGLITRWFNPSVSTQLVGLEISAQFEKLGWKFQPGQTG